MTPLLTISSKSTGACAASTPAKCAPTATTPLAGSNRASARRLARRAVVAVSLPDKINQLNQFGRSFANSHKVNCGADADGYVHGGINVGLGCSGDSIKRCIDQNLGISGNTDYVCNTTG